MREFGVFDTYILSEEPFWFTVWLRETSIKYDLFVFAFLCFLIQQWPHEIIRFLSCCGKKREQTKRKQENID